MNFWQKILDWLDNFLAIDQTIIPPVFDSHTNDTPLPKAPQTSNSSPTATITPTIETIPQMVLRVCKSQNLTQQQTNDVYNTIRCESGFNPKCVHPNLVKGKVSTTDYGICQVNDYWHIGASKDFPSVDFVMNNPEACVVWMCKMCKAGKLNLWVCYSGGYFKNGYMKVV